MKKYYVSYLKDGDLFETVVMANSPDEARRFISEKENIPFNFEIRGNYYNSCTESNHVSAVIELKIIA